MEDNSQNRGVPYVPEHLRTQRHIYDTDQLAAVGIMGGLIALALLGALVCGLWHTVP